MQTVKWHFKMKTGSQNILKLVFVHKRLKEQQGHSSSDMIS